ncbi:MAG: protease modulator HflC [Thermoguttaceae bacterium]
MVSTTDQLQDPVEKASRRGIGTFLWRIGFAVFLVAMLAVYSMTVQVPEGFSAVITRFGRPIEDRIATHAGLHWKLPYPIEQSHPIDMRRRIFNTPYTATFTRDRKNIILLDYVVWRVEKPLLFLQSVGTPEAAEQKLTGMVADKKNYHMGNFDLASLVSTKSADIKAEEIEALVLRDIQGPALEKFGIQVEQIGIKRIAYPEENMSAVLDQMRAERKSEAGELRAMGEKEAQRIRDEAVVKSEEILRQGREEAGKVLGRAEKDAAEIYAHAHRLDPDFYAFWRSLQAIKKTLGSKATIILRNDEGPFKALFELPQFQNKNKSNSAATPNAAAPARNAPAENLP